MDLSNLQPAPGAAKSRKRIGRGQGSGLGGTSTRGHKGAKSRSGYKRKIGFEGGQMPLQRRLPKFGFKNPFRVEYKPINLSTLELIATELNTDTITPEVFRQRGLINKKALVKILGNGTLSKALKVEANAFSASAEKAITEAGGTAIKL